MRKRYIRIRLIALWTFAYSLQDYLLLTKSLTFTKYRRIFVLNGKLLKGTRRGYSKKIKKQSLFFYRFLRFNCSKDLEIRCRYATHILIDY